MEKPTSYTHGFAAILEREGRRYEGQVPLTSAGIKAFLDVGRSLDVGVGPLAFRRQCVGRQTGHFLFPCQTLPLAINLLTIIR